MNGRAWLTLALLGIGGAGCAKDRPPPQVVVVPAPAPPPVEAAPIVGVLDSVGMALVMPVDRQRAEIEALSAGVDRDGLPSDRLRLALLLALAPEGVRDTDRARELLEGRAWELAGYEALARFVLQLLDERSARARDRLDAAVSLEAERKARRELQERLDAIIAIEADIEQRDRAGEEDDARQPRAVSPDDPVR